MSGIKRWVEVLRTVGVALLNCPRGTSIADTGWMGAGLILVMPVALLQAQEAFQADMPLWNDWIEETIESLAEDGVPEGQLDMLMAEMKDLAEQPVNLNTATREQLGQLFFLDELQQYNLLAYRTNYGRLLSIYELLVVDGFDTKTVQALSYFAYAGPVNTRSIPQLGNALKYARHRLVCRGERVVEDRAGYAPDNRRVGGNYYLGSPEKYMVRYGFAFRKKISLGFTAEKDAGEPMFSGSLADSIKNKLSGTIPGFDYYAGHLQLRPNKLLNKILLGDFQLYLGQGLNFWSGYALDNASNPSRVKRMVNDFKPHRGTEENHFLRGVAASFRFGKFRSILFLSKNKIDAVLEFPIQCDASSVVGRLRQTGYHRTATELAGRKQISMTTGGVNLEFLQSRFKVGFTAFANAFSTPIRFSTDLYNRFQSSGTQFSTAGFDYQYLFRKVNVFGEVSMCHNATVAQLHGATAVLYPGFTISLLYRNYPRAYQNFFSSPFSSGGSYNEQGLYGGLQAQAGQKTILQASLDLFRHFWLSYRSDRPSAGRKTLISLQHDLHAKTRIQFRFKSKVAERNQTSPARFVSSLQSIRKRSFRIHLIHFPFDPIKLQSRIEFSFVDLTGSTSEQGILIYQDIGWKSRNQNVQLDFRYAVFSTDSYEARIYAYERDLLYAFSVPSYYYNGMRVYLLFVYRMNNKIAIWLRCARSWYTDRNSISTGLNAVDGNAITQVKVQFSIAL